MDIDFGYVSPISIHIERYKEQLMAEVQDQVVEAVARVGITVDKEELIKALAYDREQFDRGFSLAWIKARTLLFDLRDRWVARLPKGEWGRNDRWQGIETGREMAIKEIEENMK